MKTAREFWIRELVMDSYGSCITNVGIINQWGDSAVHTIEFSAYQALERRLAIAKAALERIAWSNGNLNWLNDAAKEALKEIEG